MRRLKRLRFAAFSNSFCAALADCEAAAFVRTGARGWAGCECLVVLVGASTALAAGLSALPAFPIVVHELALGAGAAIGAGNGTETSGKGTETIRFARWSIASVLIAREDSPVARRTPTACLSA